MNNLIRFIKCESMKSIEVTFKNFASNNKTLSIEKLNVNQVSLRKNNENRLLHQRRSSIDYKFAI